MKHYLPFGIFIFLIFLIAFNIVETPSSHYQAKIEETKEYPSILNFGDVMFDRGVRNIIENRGRDPFEYIKNDLDLLEGYDEAIVNLEGPIVEMDRTLCQSKAYNFQFAKDTPTRLKSIGVSMVNIANNHSYDCLSVGYESTKQILTEADLTYIGDKDPEKSFAVKTIDGKKVAFLGLDETVQATPLQNFYPVVERLAKENDYVVVHVHWGTEYETGFTEVQQTIGHKLIDLGVDVVVGHHPHVVEPVEVYKGKAIFYSLGNFVFDQNFGDTTKGLGVGFEFQGDKTFFTLYPYQLKLFAPELLKDASQAEFCENFLTGITHVGCQFVL